ncbi:MATE efflux family protein [Bacteroidales bacterium KA00344]|nr:MATE efflux family protein [Bacteroidales bacterium KA00344]
MTRNNEIDMLNGPLLAKILKFAMPFAASSILQQLFVSVDVAIVGKFASSEALAAVGANTFLINLMINFFVGISIGASVILANHIGQRDNKSLRHAVSTTAALALASGIFLLFLGIIVSRPVLELMETPVNILEDAILYLRVYFLGAPFFMIYNFGASILRSKGDTKRPLYVLVVAGVINTLLNLLLVIGFHMSVVGVAIATDIANVFCAGVIVWLLRQEKGAFQLNVRHIRIYGTELKRILQIGVPAGFQSMVFSLSNIFIQSAINGYGSAAVAGASVSQTFDSYCYFLMSAFSGAAVTFIGQNYGAGQMARCKRIFWICMIGGAASCFVGNMLFMTFANEVLSLFTSDSEVVYYAKLRMEYVLVFQAIAASYDIPSSAMRGFGHSLEPALLTIFGTCVFRLIWVFFITPVWPGFENLMICYPVTWVITGILVCTVFVLTLRKLGKQLQKP